MSVTQTCSRAQRVAPWLAACAVCTNAFGHVTESHSIQRYDVVQPPGVSLAQALNRASPIRESGHIFYGHTQWHIQWNLRWFVLPSGRCEIRSVDITLSTTMTLPALIESSGDGSQVFANYLPALARHEEGHKQIALDAANEIDNAISHLDPMSSCQALEEQANRVGAAILEQTRKKQVDYDVLTHHGCTQGACLRR